MARKTDVELVVSAKNEAAKTFDELVDNIQQLSKEVKSGGLKGFFEDLSEGTDKLTQRQKDLAQAAKLAAQAQKELSTSAKQQERDLRAQEARIQKNVDSLAKLNAEYSEIEAAANAARAPSERLTEQFTKQRARQEELARSIEQTTIALRESQGRQDSTGGLDDKAAENIAKQRQRVIELGKAWRDTTQAIAAAQQEMAQRSARVETADQSQVAVKQRLEALREELKIAEQIQQERRKEVNAEKKASTQQVQARNEATEAVRELRKAIAEQSKAETAARNERDKSNRSLATQEKAVSKLVANAAKQKDAYDDLKQSLAGYEEAQKSAGAERQQREIEKLSNSLDRLQEQYKAATRSFASTQEQLSKASGPDPQAVAKFDALKRKIEDTEKSIEEETKALSKLQGELREAGTSTEQLAANQERLDRATEQLNREQVELNEQLKDTGQNAERASKGIRQAGKNFKVWGDDTRQTLSYLQRIRGELLAIAATYTGVFAVGGAIRSVYDASVLTQKATARLAARFDGDYQQIAEELKMVRSEADRLGIQFEILVDQYTKFLNSVPEGTLTLEQIRFTFSGIAEASRAAGLSADDVKGVFTALSQIASKGTVQLEELTGQLGERIPAAVQNAANGLSDLSGELVTTEELLARINKGEVNANLVVALAKALKDEFGPALAESLDSPLASLARFQNTLYDLRVLIAESGFIDELTKGLQEVNEQLSSEEGKEFAQNLARFMTGAIQATVVLVRNVDLLLNVFKAIIAVKIGLYLKAAFASSGVIAAIGKLLGSTTALGVGLKAVTVQSAAAALGLRAYGSAAAYALVSVRALMRAILLLPAAFYTGFAIGDYLQREIPQIAKFGVVLVSLFEKAKAKVDETWKRATIFFTGGWDLAVRDVAVMIATRIPKAVSKAVSGLSALIGLLSDDAARVIDDLNAKASDVVVGGIESGIGSLIDTSETEKELAKLEAATKKTFEDIDDFATQSFIEIDAKANPIPKGAGKEDGEQYSKELIASLSDIDFYKQGSNGGRSLAEGLMTQFKRIEQQLQEESANTLEKRLQLIRDEFQGFLDSVAKLQVEGNDEIVKIEEEALAAIEKQESLRDQGRIKAEIAEKNISQERLVAEQKVAKIREELAQFDSAAGQTQALVELLEAQETQKFNDEQNREAQKEINDLIVQRKADQTQINELSELGLISTEEHATRLSEINGEYLTKIREAVTAAKELAATTNNVDLAKFTEGFEGFEALEKRRSLVQQMSAYEQQINDILDLRNTKIDAINIARESGAKSTAAAEREITEIFVQSDAELTEIVAKAKELAVTLGDEKMVAKLEGIQAGIGSVRDRILDADQVAQDFSSGFVNAMEEFAKGTMSAKNAFRSFIADFTAQIAKAIAQALILRAITAALGGFGGGAAANTGAAGITGGGAAGVYHTGGIAGQPKVTRTVDPSWFINAVRYHTGGIAGLKPDEVPAILQRGERITPKDQVGQEGSGGQGGITVVNTIDPASVMEAAFNSPIGRKILMNEMRAGKDQYKSVLS